MILGALLVQGIRTGPGLFTGQGDIVYTFIFGLLIATILMLPVGLLVGRYAYQAIVSIPKAVLVPTVAFLTIIGSFAIHKLDARRLHDARARLPPAGSWRASASRPRPIVLGIILGPIAEQGFVQAWLIGNARATCSACSSAARSASPSRRWRCSRCSTPSSPTPLKARRARRAGADPKPRETYDAD